MPEVASNGFVVFDADPRVTRWATRAHDMACGVCSDPGERAKWLRHGETWFVGVDALANLADGSIDAVPLAGAWTDIVHSPTAWHRAQVSVIYRGFPKQDVGESDAAHRFRVKRCGAHVDGLHLENGRRIVREPHAFILGLPLNESDACPLVIWRGSHLKMRAALKAAILDMPVIGADVTEAYKAARAKVLETCDPVEVHMSVGQAVLLDRFALHGVAPWRDGMSAPPEGRMIAYFRPDCPTPNDWIRD